MDDAADGTTERALFAGGLFHGGKPNWGARAGSDNVIMDGAPDQRQIAF